MNQLISPDFSAIAEAFAEALSQGIKNKVSRGFGPNCNICWAKAHRSIIILFSALKDGASHSPIFQLFNTSKVKLE